MTRRAFTLLEMLVASAVFVIGFVSLFALFLAGIRYRKLSEDVTRSSLAAASLVAEFRLEAGWENHPPYPPAVGAAAPSEYIGDGFAGNGVAATDSPDILYRYANQPGIWYRVTQASGLAGLDNADTTAVRISLVVVPWSGSDSQLTFTQIDRQLQLGAGAN
ncbi:MAG: prepilin-type N-terminal cleavage/methylation domain-containing protein, partial [Planctomycetes bacterium]|nr:prepilin-type N-terminal cleavage/methylation domain-containing protein [Planctomycetota bacterium]